MSANEHRDGGPAFPHIADGMRVGETGVVTYRKITSNGMTLRDWFAGQALAGMLARDEGSSIRLLVVSAYDHADAMLAERERSR